jgi:uncharacterized short protein YbdD (DUF466 family)
LLPEKLLPDSALLKFLGSFWIGARETARRMIGVPDYAAYLRHAREHHPGQAPLSYAEFFARAQSARYRGTGGRCC